MKILRINADLSFRDPSFKVDRGAGDESNVGKSFSHRYLVVKSEAIGTTNSKEEASSLEDVHEFVSAHWEEIGEKERKMILSSRLDDRVKVKEKPSGILDKLENTIKKVFEFLIGSEDREKKQMAEIRSLAIEGGKKLNEGRGFKDLRFNEEVEVREFKKDNDASKKIRKTARKLVETKFNDLPENDRSVFNSIRKTVAIKFNTILNDKKYSFIGTKYRKEASEITANELVNLLASNKEFKNLDDLKKQLLENCHKIQKIESSKSIFDRVIEGVFNDEDFQMKLEQYVIKDPEYDKP